MPKYTKEQLKKLADIQAQFAPAHMNMGSNDAYRRGWDRAFSKPRPRRKKA